MNDLYVHVGSESLLRSPVDEFPPVVARFFERNILASKKFVADESNRTAWLLGHHFRPAADVCIDGRLIDFPDVIGIPRGVLELFRSGGARAGLRSLSYKDRCVEGIRRAGRLIISGQRHPMVELRMRVAHYSSSQPDRLSCAKWNNQTEAALRGMQEHCDQLNDAFASRIVAFPVLLDTDRDAITLVGPEGRVSVTELSKQIGPLDACGDRLATIHFAIAKAFPKQWKPLARLSGVFQGSFHRELTEHLAANLNYVITNGGEERPPEFLEHRETLVFIGRHLDWIGPEDAKSVFLVDDTGKNDDVLDDFMIGMGHVARNTIRTAVLKEDRNWSVPVVVNIPYDDDCDEDANIIYARELVRDLQRHLNKGEVKARLAEELFKGIGKKSVPDWMYRHINEIHDHVFFVGARSLRADRLFRPFRL